MRQFLKDYLNVAQLNDDQHDMVFEDVHRNSDGEIDQCEMAVLIMQITGKSNLKDYNKITRLMGFLPVYKRSM